MVAAKEKRRVEMAALELKWRVEMAAVEGVAERSVRMAAGEGTEESEWQPWREDWVKRKCWNGRGKGNANAKTVEVERVYLETDYRHFSPYVSSYVTAVCAFFFFFSFPFTLKIPVTLGGAALHLCSHGEEERERCRGMSSAQSWESCSITLIF